MLWLIVLLVLIALLVPTAYAGWIGAPYAPTRMPVVDKAFDQIGLGKEDVLVDLGAGDGKILLAAIKRDARAYGFELSPIMWLVTAIRLLGKRSATVKFGNFYHRDISDATIVFSFLMPQSMPRVKEYLARQKLPRGRYLLVYMFPFQDVPPRQVIRAPRCGAIYVYDLKQLTGETKRGKS